MTAQSECLSALAVGMTFFVLGAATARHAVRLWADEAPDTPGRVRPVLVLAVGMTYLGGVLFCVAGGLFLRAAFEAARRAGWW